MDENTTAAVETGIGIRKDSDYSYIWIFIEFLKEIIKIIKDLFSGIDLSSLFSGGAKEEPTTEA